MKEPQFITRRRCDRCAAFMLLVGRVIPVPCPDIQRTPRLNICQQRAPLSIGSEVAA